MSGLLRTENGERAGSPSLFLFASRTSKGKELQQRETPLQLSIEDFCVCVLVRPGVLYGSLVGSPVGCTAAV